jgi:hypothetical protein
MWKLRCVTGESPSETSRQQQHTRRAFTFDSGRLHCDGDFHSLAYPPSSLRPYPFSLLIFNELEYNPPKK